MKPILSIIIPAFNEELYIARTISAIQKALVNISEVSEIIVVDNNSTDNTAKISRDMGARVVFEPINQISRSRNRGAREALGECLVFVDADTLITAKLLSKSMDNMRQQCCCGGGSIVEFDEDVPFFAKIFTSLWNWLAVKRGLAAGSFIYCIKKAFDETGGFSEAVYASEEIWFSRNIRSWGKKRELAFTVIPDYPVVTSSRKFHWYSSISMFVNLLFLMTFPWALRSKKMCKIWYDRP